MSSAARWLLAALAAALAGLIYLCAQRLFPPPPPPTTPPASCAYPADPASPPATPSSPGWPAGVAYRGSWVQPAAVVVTATQRDFVWASTWGVGSAVRPGVGRAVIFRLEGNPNITIVDVTGGGLVSALDGRSAYGCADAAGQITVTLNIPAGAAPAGDGALWGIDVGNGTVGGARADFEVTTP